MKMAKTGHFYSARHPYAKAEFLVFFGPLRHSKVPHRRTSLLRRNEAPPRRTDELFFTCSLSLSLTIIHWIKKNPNK